MLKFDESVRIFFRERLEFYLKDVRGYAYDVVKAVLAADADDVVDALARAEAVKQVMHMPEFQAIGAACKRMRNILRQASDKKIKPAEKFEYLPEAADEEKSLMAFMESTSEKVEAHRSKKNIWKRCCCCRPRENRSTDFSTKSWLWLKMTKCGRTGWHCCVLY